jgi:hypothetical protein
MGEWAMAAPASSLVHILTRSATSCGNVYCLWLITEFVLAMDSRTALAGLRRCG